jgi:hypothetical protein
MTQRWYQKASVQAAIVAGVFLVVTTVVAALLGWILPANRQPVAAVTPNAAPDRDVQRQIDHSANEIPRQAGASLEKAPPRQSVAPSATGASVTSLSRNACTVVDVYKGDRVVLENVTLRCGPKGNIVLSANSTFRFTLDLDEIASGVFPERVLAFGRVRRVDFRDLDSAETEAVLRYAATRSDFFAREWRKASVNFVDGAVWEEVYIYDKCHFEGALEAGDLAALNPNYLIFRRTEGECS